MGEKVPTFGAPSCRRQICCKNQGELSKENQKLSIHLKGGENSRCPSSTPLSTEPLHFGEMPKHCPGRECYPYSVDPIKLQKSLSQGVFKLNMMKIFAIALPEDSGEKPFVVSFSCIVEGELWQTVNYLKQA